MFERPSSGEFAVLVHMDMDRAAEAEELQEFRELVASAGVEAVAVVTGQRRQPDPRLFIGAGKADEVRQTLEATGAEVVIFNHSLSPSQERNLEREFKCRVVDRTGLILDIFAQRARSHEGKLQVELAQLRHLSTRLVRGWTHLERQKGGIGLRGPGETQLETDRRLLAQRIAQLNKRLEKVRSQRGQSRRARDRAEVPTVSLVGYTNAGKSTLFNALTRSGVYAADQLFATLDPTLRKLDLAEGVRVVLADTVGFIRHLPHDLVAAFRSTLEETASASLLLHVIDNANTRRELCKAEVNSVLKQIDADQVPQIEVFNKIDLQDDVEPRVERGEDGLVRRVWLSAQDGRGLDQLLEAIGEYFHQQKVRHILRLAPADGRLRALLFSVGEVLRDQPMDDGGWEIEIELDRAEYARLDRRIEGLEARLIA